MRVGYFKEEIYELKSKRYKKRMLIAIVILIVGIMAFFIYFNVFVAKECKELDCYEKALLKCKKIWFIREEDNYVWRYEILKAVGKDACNVETRLLKINLGKLNIEDLQGKTMVCKVQRVDDIFPEKDMLRCNGILKEELQEIIIDRMHNYLLKNLGEIQEGLKEI